MWSIRHANKREDGTLSDGRRTVTYPSDEIEQCVFKDVIIRSRAARGDSEEFGDNISAELGPIVLNAYLRELRYACR